MEALSKWKVTEKIDGEMTNIKKTMKFKVFISFAFPIDVTKSTCLLCVYNGKDVD